MGVGDPSSKELDKVSEKQTEKFDKSSGRVIRLPATLTARQILATEYPEPTWAVPGLISEGVTILAGGPKIGKSYLCLHIALAVASGGTVLGKIEVTPRRVLYIALEDTYRRLGSRMRKILHGNPEPDRIHFAYSWPRLDGTGLQDLRSSMEQHPDIGLIIIDTLVRIRSSKRTGSPYEADYNEISRIKALADEFGICIVVVHHLRKTKAQDIFDLVSGSTGLTAAADTVAILLRERSQADATLFVSGREVEEQELALRFEFDSGSWVLLGEAAACRLSEERQEIVDLLESEGGPMKLGDIASALGKKKPNLLGLLSGLTDQGLVEKAGHGKYQLKPAPGGSDGPRETSSEETGESSDPGE